MAFRLPSEEQQSLYRDVWKQLRENVASAPNDPSFQRFINAPPSSTRKPIVLEIRTASRGLLMLQWFRVACFTRVCDVVQLLTRTQTIRYPKRLPVSVCWSVLAESISLSVRSKWISVDGLWLKFQGTTGLGTIWVWFWYIRAVGWSRNSLSGNLKPSSNFSSFRMPLRRFGNLYITCV